RTRPAESGSRKPWRRTWVLTGSTLEPRRSRRPARERAARGIADCGRGAGPARARAAPFTSRAAMNRRYWPRLLAVLSLAILGSYLLYTEHLVREIRAEAAVYTRIYALVQGGLLASEEDGPLGALTAIQLELQQLGVPIIYLNTESQPTAALNLPFEADLGDRKSVVEGNRGCK